MDAQRTIYILPMPLPRLVYQVEIHRWRSSVDIRTAHAYYAVRPSRLRTMLRVCGFDNPMFPPFRVGLSMIAENLQLRIALPGVIGRRP
jgi:hypothetical protein